MVKAHVVDYAAKQNRHRFNLGKATVIPHSPRRLILSKITLNTGRKMDKDDNKVELLATVGVRGVKGISQLMFRIFRNGKEIYNTRQGIESAGSEMNYVVSFQAIDSNISGMHTYTLTVENVVKGTTAEIVGPLNFSGLSIRRNDRT